MKTLRNFTVATFVCLIALSASAQKPAFHAGQWWKDKNSVYREAFVNGFKSGMHHAANHNTELSPFTATVLVDGVNKFYSDFRNLNINIDDALQYVTDQMSGVPDDKLKAQIMKLRANAVGMPNED
jgi:hypothetical protein